MCSVDMHQVHTSSHYGVSMALDQCKKCGGIWFDGLELYRANKNAAKKNELLDAATFRKKMPLQKEVLQCPTDTTPLRAFSDPNFPKSIQIESCPVCQGFWLNHGEFTEFQKLRAEKRERYAQKKKERDAQDEGMEKQLRAIVAAHNQPDMMDTLGHLGRFLSQPVDRPSVYNISKRGNASAVADTFSAIILVLLKIIFRV